MKNYRIILVEDNDIMRLGILDTLLKEGYTVIAHDNGLDALEDFKIKNYDIAVLDLKMSPINGLEVLTKIKELKPSVEALIVSAFGTVNDAVEAIKLGANDFLTKPFSPDELRLKIKKIIEKIENNEKIETLLEHNKLLVNELYDNNKTIIACNAKMKNILEMIDKIASNDSNVLIIGESGTGKELVAHDIHKKSKRANMPFIKVNCAALNDNLLESELFGHEKGAFTGAIKRKKGRFELADSGTIFLDEIGDISPVMQVKLLRVLQEGEFERVGGEETIKVNLRVIAATNKDLQKLIMKNEFREDLFYRLNIIPINLPPLRERKEDIPTLVDFFLNKFAMKNKQEIKTISKDGYNLLVDFNWAGNIRELENFIERLIVVSSDKNIESEFIYNQLHQNSNNTKFENLPLDDALYNFEKNMIVQAMKKADGVKNRAAKNLGVNTSALYYKLEKFGLL